MSNSKKQPSKPVEDVEVDVSDDDSDLDDGQELSLVITALQSAVDKKHTSTAPAAAPAPVSTAAPATDEDEETELFFEQPSSPIPSHAAPPTSADASEPDDAEKHAKDTQDAADGEQNIDPPSPGTPPPRSRQSEDIDAEFSANLISIESIKLKNMRANTLTPRQQERADEPVLRAVRHLFNNRFMRAKKLFERYSQFEPLHALGLGSMAFMKAIMSADEKEIKNAIKVLTTTYGLANAQVDVATSNSVVSYVTNYYNHIKYSRGASNGSGLATGKKPLSRRKMEKEGVDFYPNGVLRAHVAKAECCLQMAILYLLQENVMGYIKCGLNIRRAYVSYSLVWQEYKRMGQEYNDFIDRDTVSGIQFGIGAVHLILSSLPEKILRVVSAFGWTADRNLGIALLKICVEDGRIRSPMASLMLLAYYTVLTSFCPQILGDEYTQPAIEALLEAQRTYPNSAFFLYFAGRTSRLARNLTLSTQSFTYGIEISKNEWAEIEVMHLYSYEIGFNHMMQLEWAEAGKLFDMLYKEKYWSPAIFRYLQGACLDMMGQRTEAILAFAEVPDLVGAKVSSTAMMENYVVRKVKTLQVSGYQDMDMSACALEYLCLYNAFDFMTENQLHQCLTLIERAQSHIVDAEQVEFGIRTRELLPQTPVPEYYNQRAAILLIKSCIQNAMGAYRDSIIHLNWIMDNKEKIKDDKWIIPFTYWEAGVVSCGLGNKKRALTFWETALKYGKYDFEYRLAMRINLAMVKIKEELAKLEKAKRNMSDDEDEDDDDDDDDDDDMQDALDEPEMDDDDLRLTDDRENLPASSEGNADAPQSQPAEQPAKQEAESAAEKIAVNDAQEKKTDAQEKAN
ncbi:hypothetical protein BC940DRAFT_309529 [Gongronella butleri]|nr:hypothetical protein BC940DRAFT_309529 [Gongronella butleri]